MNIRLSYVLIGLCALVPLAVPATAGPITQCPAGINGTGSNDAWPSCAYLLTINPDNTVTVTADTTLLQNIFNDTFDPEDILIGVQNNSGGTQFAIRIQGDPTAEFFAFDPSSTPDFPYTGNGNVFFSDLGPASDDADDACALCIEPVGTVNFTGGLTNGSSTWFGLEGASQVDGDPLNFTATLVPEPANIFLVGFSLAGLGLVLLRRQAPASPSILAARKRTWRANGPSTSTPVEPGLIEVQASVVLVAELN